MTSSRSIFEYPIMLSVSFHTYYILETQETLQQTGFYALLRGKFSPLERVYKDIDGENEAVTEMELKSSITCY